MAHDANTRLVSLDQVRLTDRFIVIDQFYSDDEESEGSTDHGRIDAIPLANLTGIALRPNDASYRGTLINTSMDISFTGGLGSIAVYNVTKDQYYKFLAKLDETTARYAARPAK